MGIDGMQRLEIRGPSHILDTLQETQLVLEDDGLAAISARFFGKRLEFNHRSSNLLEVSYEFRNEPVYQYLTALLRTYPMCWIKNTYMGDDGSCGLWIGRTVRGQPSIQTLEWQELCAEELYQGEDFST